MSSAFGRSASSPDFKILVASSNGVLAASDPPSEVAAASIVIFLETAYNSCKAALLNGSKSLALIAASLAASRDPSRSISQTPARTSALAEEARKLNLALSRAFLTSVLRS